MNFTMDAWGGTFTQGIGVECSLCLAVKHEIGVIQGVSGNGYADHLHRPAGREGELRMGDERVRDDLFGFTRNAACGGNRLEKR